MEIRVTKNTPALMKLWRIALWAAAACFASLFAARGLAGDDFKNRAAAQAQILKIHTVLEERQPSLNPSELDALAQSIVEESQRQALDAMLLLAVIHVESRFDPRAVSSRGAQGLMQIRPVAVAALVDGERIPRLPPGVDLKDPAVNIWLGASYLALLLEMFGDLKLGLAAYNQGPTRVKSLLAARQKISFVYAEKVLAAQREFESATMASGMA